MEKLKNSVNVATTLPPLKSIEEFLASVKKGSKKFRDIIDKSVYEYNSTDMQDLTSIRSFCDISLQMF